MCLLSEVYLNKRDTHSSTNIMEIDVGANLACRYFSAKNSEPAGKLENTVDAARPRNHDQGLIIS